MLFRGTDRSRAGVVAPSQIAPRLYGFTVTAAALSVRRINNFDHGAKCGLGQGLERDRSNAEIRDRVGGQGQFLRCAGGTK